MGPSTAAFDNGPSVTFEEFTSLFDRLKTWSDCDEALLERGALRYITPEVTRDAGSLVTTGEIAQMALAWNTVTDLDNTKPALHYMSELGEPGPLQPTCNKDFIGIDFHGKAASHLDAITHIAFNDQLFGGVSSKASVDATGSSWGTVDKIGPIVTRGVLLDIARHKNVEWLEPGTAVRASDVLAMEERFGFKLQSGDCVLLRNGHFARKRKLGTWDPTNLSAGFHVDVMELMRDREVSVIGADGDSDVRPSPVEGVDSPIHVLALPGLGIPLLDNLDLEPVAQQCASHNRWTFQIIVAPLNIPRGTGSPVNPVAVF